MNQQFTCIWHDREKMSSVVAAIMLLNVVYMHNDLFLKLQNCYSALIHVLPLLSDCVLL